MTKHQNAIQLKKAMEGPAGNPPVQPARVIPMQWWRKRDISTTSFPAVNDTTVLPATARVFIKQNRQFAGVLLADIQFITAKDNYISLFANGRSYLLRQSLKDMEAILSADFVRIHRCHIINTLHLASFTGDEAVLGNQHLPIGANFYGQLVGSLFVLGR
jgi:DNA-binding LytR/AlgR family response regulator